MPGEQSLSAAVIAIYCVDGYIRVAVAGRVGCVDEVALYPCDSCVFLCLSLSFHLLLPGLVYGLFSEGWARG